MDSSTSIVIKSAQIATSSHGRCGGVIDEQFQYFSTMGLMRKFTAGVPLSSRDEDEKLSDGTMMHICAFIFIDIFDMPATNDLS